MATTDSKAPLRTVKRVQFGILAPDEIVSTNFSIDTSTYGGYQQLESQWMILWFNLFLF